MTERRTHKAGRARWAITAVMALVLGAGAAPAQAAEIAPITGKVHLPDGAKGSDFYVQAYSHDPAGGWRSEDQSDVAADGSFSLDWVLEGVAYRLFLLNYDRAYTSGWYAGPGVPHVPSAEEGVDVIAPASGIELEQVPSATITGSYTLPDGFDWVPGGFRIVLERLNHEGAWVEQTRFTTYKGSSHFFHQMLRRDAVHRILVEDAPENPGPQRFPAGYVRVGAPGLVADPAFATHFTGDVEGLVIPIGSELVAPELELLSAPELRGRAVVGETLEVSTGSWSLEGASFTYAWLRDGVEVSGARSARYRLSAADAGARIAARVTAAVPGVAPVSTTTTQLLVAPTPAPEKIGARTKPSIKGEARLGKTLRASAGTWTVPGVRVAYQWLRGGKPIKGATSSRFKLTTKDVGKRVSVRVTARRAGYTEGVASSSAKKVAKGKPKVTAKVKNVKAGQRAKLSVRVKVAGLAKPRGTLVVRYGAKKLSVKLAAKRKGRLGVRLPRLGKGTHKIRVTFEPTGSSKKYVKKASSKRVTLRVR